MTYLYQSKRRFFAQTAPGLEEAAARELAALGATHVDAQLMGVAFCADKATLYRANYTSRLVSRILAPLIAFPYQTDDDLYHPALSLKWTDFLKRHQTFAVYATRSKNSRSRHTGYGALKIKDAVADFFVRKFKNRPNVDKRAPDVWINVHLERQKATLSIDTSGGSLHKRGYRQKSVDAPMQETVAAAILQLSRWDGSRPLCDPMCGSGTLLTEALMRYSRIPAGFLRKTFGFENLPDFDRQTWQRLKTECDRQIRPLPVGLINGSDRSETAIAATRTNSRRLPFGNRITLKTERFQRIGGLPDSLIVCNPPYGIRLENRAAAARLYGEFGDFLKQKCQGATAYVYFGEHQMVKHLGLKPAWKKPIKNGGLDGRLVKYDVY